MTPIVVSRAPEMPAAPRIATEVLGCTESRTDPAAVGAPRATPVGSPAKVGFGPEETRRHSAYHHHGKTLVDGSELEGIVERQHRAGEAQRAD